MILSRTVVLMQNLKNVLFPSLNLEYNLFLVLVFRIGIMKLLQEHGQPNLEKDYDEVIKDEMENYEKRFHQY